MSLDSRFYLTSGKKYCFCGFFRVIMLKCFVTPFFLFSVGRPVLERSAGYCCDLRRIRCVREKRYWRAPIYKNLGGYDTSWAGR